MKLYLSSYKFGNEPEELLRLLGPGRRTAAIFNAGDAVASSDNGSSYRAAQLSALRDLGLDPYTLDLRAFFGKPPTEVEEALEGTDLVWVNGGNAFVLKRAFDQSGLSSVLPAMVHKDELAYGGFSAGAIMATPTLRGIELVDDPEVVPEGYDRILSWDCMNLVDFSIAPHYRSDHPESEMIEKVVEYFTEKGLPYRPLRDGEALVVDASGPRVVR